MLEAEQLTLILVCNPGYQVQTPNPDEDAY